MKAEDVLRNYRDSYLKETDWVVTRALEQGSEVPNSWKTYRQKLRDLPANSSPKVADGVDLNKDAIITLDSITNVTWPTRPS